VVHGSQPRAFDYVDRTSHPGFGRDDMRQIKEAAYDTQRMMFDPKGFERLNPKN
jgi:hypothetical protein